MNSEYIYSDIYNYDVPVFKISSKDGYSKVILNKLTLSDNYKNINYNSNCIRWLRKVNISGSSNPYFSTNAPENEFHLCSLYLSPWNYKSREEVIDEINKQLKIVAYNLFTNNNSVKNLYTENRYSGRVNKPVTLTNLTTNSGEIIYPNVTTTGKYRLLIKNLGEYGVSYSFNQPNTLILFRDGDVYKSLELILTQNYINENTIKESIEGFASEYIDGNDGNFLKLVEALMSYKLALEEQVPDYKDPTYTEKRRLYDTYCTIIDSYRMNDTNYAPKDGMYEIYNGLVRSNGLTKLINEEVLVFDHKDFDELISLIYNGKTTEIKTMNEIINYTYKTEEKSVIFGYDWLKLGHALFNLIYNFMLAYRRSIINHTDFKYSMDDIINACIALNIYEIDESFINNFINLHPDDFVVDEDILLSLSERWIARLLNQFIFHLLYGRISTTNQSQYDLMHGINQYQSTAENDSIDWFVNKIISITKKLSEKYSEFDVIDTNNPLFTGIDFAKREDGTTDEQYDSTKVHLVSYLITRVDEKLIPALSSSLRFMVQAYLLNSYVELEDDVINNQTIYKTYTDIKEANLNDVMPIKSITYNLYTETGVKKLDKGVEFTSNDQEAFDTIISSTVKYETSETVLIGDTTLNRIASTPDSYLRLVLGEINGIINKIINVGDPFTITVNGEEITIKTNEYLQLLGDSNNISALKIHAIINNEEDPAITSLTEKMDIVQNLNKETIFNNTGSINSDNKDASALLSDPYFRDLSDGTITPFVVDSEAKRGIISNIGKLMFIEPNEDVMPSTSSFSKEVYTIVNNRYSYNPDVYLYDKESKRLTKNTSAYKLFKYNERDEEIPNEYFKHKENRVNVATKIGLPFWKSDISSDALYLLKLPNYTEVPFDGSLTPAYNIHTTDSKIHLVAGTTCTNNLVPFIFNLFATEQLNFASEFSLILPPVMYACAITNKDVEKVISRSDSSNQIYSFELDTTKSVFEFSNEVKLTIPENDSIYVFISASEMPYAIPSGICRLDFDYVK